MNAKKSLENRIRGWLPKEPDSQGFRRITGWAKMDRRLRLTVVVGVTIALVIGAFLLLSIILLMLNPIVPTDVKINEALTENKDFLLNIDGVIGAGIARNNTNNHIIGIAVYIANNATYTQEIPQKLGDFTVIVKRISEVSEFEKEHMIIRREDLQ